MAAHRNRNHELEIRINIGDWEQESKDIEAAVATDDEVLKCIEEGMHPMQIGRLAVTAAELTGDRPEMLPANKVLLQQGAALKTAQFVRRQCETLRRDSDGREYTVQQWAGTVTDRDGKYTHAADPEAPARALEYLNNYVLGHIRKRLNIIAVHDGDVRAAGEMLKRKIDELILELE